MDPAGKEAWQEIRKTLVMINKIEIPFHCSFYHMAYYGNHADRDKSPNKKIRNKDNNNKKFFTPSLSVIVLRK